MAVEPSLVKSEGELSLKESLDFCNEGYRAKRKGLIWPVTAANVGLNGVYYGGHVISHSGRPVPVVLRAEEIPVGDRWALCGLEDADLAFLESAFFAGAAVFLVLGYVEHGRLFLLPFGELRKRWRHSHWGSGPITVKCGDRSMIETQFPDYLAPVAEKPNRFTQPVCITLSGGNGYVGEVDSG